MKKRSLSQKIVTRAFEAGSYPDNCYHIYSREPAGYSAEEAARKAFQRREPLNGTAMPTDFERWQKKIENW